MTGVVSSAVIAAVVAASAGIAAAWISRSIKISEFRQRWINDLRSDISAYVGAAEKWFRKYEEINSLPSEERGLRERDELFPIANDARVILRRIKLSFNPEDNPFKTKDDEFLQSLQDLIRPAPGVSEPAWSSWQECADKAVERARKILKREWEVTKKVRLPHPSDFEFQRMKSSILQHNN